MPVIHARRLIASVLLAACASASSASADVFPSRPITIVVPVAASGAIDASARLLAKRMRAALGQPVIVENVTGAGGSIGTARVARAAPDGYTLIFGGLNTHVINPAVLDLPYDVLADFEPVALTGAFPLVIVGRKTHPAGDLTALLAWLKANPDKALVGTGGPGSPSHLAGVLFEQLTGTRLAYVPYRGTGAAMGDLIAGHTDIMLDAVPNALPHVRAGAIKAYAVMTPERMTIAPEIPSVDEAGLPKFHMQVWLALWAPKRTPASIVARLNGAVIEAVNDPALRSSLAELGEATFPPDQLTPQALAAFNRAEIAKWSPIIKAAGVRSQ
jgi:tripartite-type tricarboxylate transporter receptor subunit TctC